MKVGHSAQQRGLPGGYIRLMLTSLGLGRRRVNASLGQHITQSSTVVVAVGSSTKRKLEWILREPTSRFEMTAEQATNVFRMHSNYGFVNFIFAFRC